MNVFALKNRQTVRSAVNPYDKATIVSIFPKDIRETKSTIQPGRFYIKAGSYENPSLLVVEPSSWFREMDENNPLLEIPESSIKIADSIVRDYCNGYLGCNMGDRMPGLFYVPGEFKTVELFRKAKFGENQLINGQDLIDAADKKQKSFFNELIKIADTDWARTNGNPRAVSDDARLAARLLGREDKAWLKDYQATELIQCTACGHLRNPRFPVCGNCNRVIDETLAKQLNIKTAV